MLAPYPSGMNENILLDKLLSAEYKSVINVHPAKALPNKRIVKDNNGAHIEIKLTGKKTGTGSI